MRQVWRCLQDEFAQEIDRRVDFAVERLIAFGVTGAQLRDLAGGPPFAREDVAAVRRRQKILGPPLDDLQPVVVEAQVLDHLWVEQADGVGRDRVAEAGVKLLRNRRAADDRTGVRRTFTFIPAMPR